MARAVPPELRASLAASLRDYSPLLPEALAEIDLPTYILDRKGTIRWENAAALDLLGDRRGMHFTGLVAPESQPLVRARFARKLLGTDRSTSTDVVLVRADGTPVNAEIESVPLDNDGQICGVFGVIDVDETAASTPAAEVHLTARQLEVLRLLAAGGSTASIASELHISQDTVRNHVRGILHGLGVHSRLMAVLRAHELGLA